MEYLSDASFLGKIQVFPANVRLDYKVIASCKHSSLFGLIDSDEGKKFYNIDTWSNLIKLFRPYVTNFCNKLELERLTLARVASLV